MNRVLLMAIVLAALAYSAVPAAPPARSYDFSREDVRKALQDLGAFEDATLPMLEGFVALDAEQIKNYDAPHYQFRVEFKEAAPGQTLVSLEARISARYNDGSSVRSDYRSVPTNGRLEADMLDRLKARLTKAGGPPLEGAALQEQIAKLHSEASAAEQRRLEMEKEIHELSQIAPAQASVSKLVSVGAGGAAVLERPADAAHVIFRADAEDELEVVSERGPWLEVHTASNSTGWIRRSKMSQDGEPAPQGPRHFVISREEATAFSGEWSALNGKQALFIWARPAPDAGTAATPFDEWNYAKRVFVDAYRTIKHAPRNASGPIAGVVVVFAGSQAAVAAATLADIGQWAEGSLPEATFTKRCSLDPEEAFRDVQKAILVKVGSTERNRRLGQ